MLKVWWTATKDLMYLTLGYKMKKNSENIFQEDSRKRKKLKVKGINNLAHNSGYIHDWKEQKKVRRNKILKYAAVYGGLLTATIAITIFINLQNLEQAKRDKQEFLASITPAPTQVVQSASPEPIDYSREFDTARIMYEDTVGYLIIPGTNIDFPIVQGEDNYFLKIEITTEVIQILLLPICWLSVIQRLQDILLYMAKMLISMTDLVNLMHS